MKHSIYFLLSFVLFSSFLFTSCDDDDEDVVQSGAKYTISGSIRTSAGAGVANILVELSGAKSATTTTDANGNFTFTDLESGNYNITPRSEDYKFDPSTKTFSNLSSNQTFNFTQLELIIGKWVSTGENLAPLLLALFPYDSIYATFNSNNTYNVVAIDTGGVSYPLNGTYTVSKSDVGNIYNITLNQTSPTPLTSVGIYEININQTPHFMTYEVAQTEPNIGAIPPTSEGGFGSTNGGALGTINVQKYIRLE
ncbi:MAG: hypothetical protein STSR0008_07250 [Ignavibacterium sp.]